MPTDSITEDLLSTLVLLRRGYVTRYLNERLSMGLCPENLDGFFKQRERWCRGNLQTLFLKAGPLGSGLSLRQRLQFLSLDWVVHYGIRLLAVLVPIVFLWTGVGPFVIPSLLELISYQFPMLLALLGVMRWFAPNGYMPVLSTAATLFGSFRIVPAGLATLIKAFGTPFQVTPKGSGITFRFGDPTVLVAAFALIMLTVGGVIKNRIAPSAAASSGAVMLVAEAWALVNVVLLAVVSCPSVGSLLDCRLGRDVERMARLFADPLPLLKGLHGPTICRSTRNCAVRRSVSAKCSSGRAGDRDSAATASLLWRP